MAYEPWTGADGHDDRMIFRVNCGNEKILIRIFYILAQMRVVII
jgi:hypothetical protein